MAEEKLIPLYLDGRPVDVAMTPADFFRKKTMPKGDAGALVTAADAGYELGDRFENLELYTGPKTQRQYDHEREERRAVRSAPRTEVTPEPVKVDDKPASELVTPAKDEKAK